MYETTVDSASYVAILEAARVVATAQLDDNGTLRGIDEATREKARAFLRSEFEKWTEVPDADDEEQTL